MTQFLPASSIFSPSNSGPCQQMCHLGILDNSLDMGGEETVRKGKTSGVSMMASGGYDVSMMSQEER
jgi:hypothetical protein